MQDKTIQVADEFCRLVKQPNLLEYLGLPPYSTADEAMDKLRARRRYMQGMQSNPKFKDEALFLIKNYSALLAALQDPQKHLDVMEQRRRAENLPDLEAAIRNILDSGTLGDEQEEFLHRIAIELGVPNDIYQDVLDRLARDSGIERPTGGVADSAGFWSNDPFVVLDVSEDATLSVIEHAYERRRKQARSLPRITLSNRALNQLAAALEAIRDGRTLIQPDLELNPARMPPTANKSGDMPTAPPKRRTHEQTVDDDIVPKLIKTPARPGRREHQKYSNIEIVGEPMRHLYLKRRMVKERIQIRSRNQLPLYGTISTNVGWLHASPARLNGEKSQTEISVRINPNEMVNSKERGTVTIHPEAGQAVHVRFEVQLIKSWSIPLLIAAFVFALFISIFAFRLFPTNNDPNFQAGGLVITVDPMASVIMLNGDKIGAGTNATLSDPPIGAMALTVVQSNFRTYQGTVSLEPGKIERKLVVLELESTMDFRPTPNMVLGDLGDLPLRSVPADLMNNCMKKGALVAPAQSKLQIYIGNDGKAAGVQIDGPANEDSVVRRCLIRYAATVSFPPLKNGDYGLVGYTVQLDEDP